MNVFLDLDGTLTDSAPGITRCLAHALASLGAQVPDVAALRSCIGPPLDHSFRRLLGTDDAARIAEAIAHYRERFAASGMYENAVYAGIPENLAALRAAGRRLFVVTSKPRVYAAQIVEHFELSGFFENVYGPDEDGVLHDKADLIARVLSAESIAPETATMVGDRSHDVLGARKNGVASVGVLWGYGSRAELMSAGAGALLASPYELSAALTGGAKGA